ncbi:MAG: hypothetical protein OXT65_00280 [Alphaproteobacteria bacterium]|nr:hypothetical protein [Alphaproteobacteria bacterium]
MNAIRQHECRFHRALFTLVILALCAQTLIPPGFMPSFKQGDVFALDICSSTGPLTILVDKNMQPIKQHAPRKNKKHDLCPFGFAPVASYDVPIQLPAAQNFHARHDLPLPAAVSILSRVFTWRQRGPPRPVF